MARYATSASNAALASGSSTAANLIGSLGIVPGTGQTFWLTGMVLGDTTSTDAFIAVQDATSGAATTGTNLMRLKLPCYGNTPSGPVQTKQIEFPNPGYKFTTGVAAYVIGASGPIATGTIQIMGYLE
jgi:hypothetical protein